MSISHQLYWYMDAKPSEIPVWKVFKAAAELARKQGSISDVEPLYRKAIMLASRSPGEPHKEIVEILWRLGEFQVERGEYEAAGATYKSAVEILESDGGRGSFLLLAALSRLAEMYELNGKTSASEAVWTLVKQNLADHLRQMVEH